MSFVPETLVSVALDGKLTESNVTFAKNVDFLQKPKKGLKCGECRPGPNLQMIIGSCYSLSNGFGVLNNIYVRDVIVKVPHV